MKSSILYIDFDERGHYVDVHYRRATRHYYSIADAPESVKQFLRNANQDNMYKMIAPAFDGENVYEITLYRVIA